MLEGVPSERGHRCVAMNEFGGSFGGRHLHGYVCPALRSVHTLFFESHGNGGLVAPRS